MEDEYCQECGAKILSSKGFCQECGAITKTFANQLKEKEEIKRKEKEFRSLKAFYRKEDKNILLAFIYSLLVPFLGTLYLKEDDLNLSLCGISILVYIAFIVSCFTVTDFLYISSCLLFIGVFIVLYVISLIYLIIMNFKYNKNKEIYIGNSDFQKESRSFLSKIVEHKFFKIFPVILIACCLVGCLVCANDAPDKTFSNEDFSFSYPGNYSSINDPNYGLYCIYSVGVDNKTFAGIEESNDYTGDIFSIMKMDESDFCNHLYYYDEWEKIKFKGLNALKSKDRCCIVVNSTNDYKDYYYYINYDYDVDSQKILNSLHFN